MQTFVWFEHLDFNCNIKKNDNGLHVLISIAVRMYLLSIDILLYTERTCYIKCFTYRILSSQENEVVVNKLNFNFPSSLKICILVGSGGASNSSFRGVRGFMWPRMAWRGGRQWQVDTTAAQDRQRLTTALYAMVRHGGRYRPATCIDV